MTGSALQPVLGLALLVATSPAIARDYGTLGPTWAIAEPDLLDVIRARLKALDQSGELAALNRQFAEAARATIEHPHPVVGLTPATSDRQWLFDPTVTLADDIRDAHGNLLAAKGQRFNPLHIVAMDHAFAFIDGDDTAQIAWAMKQGAPDKLWVVLVKGSPTERMRDLKRRFWFDQDGAITRRFGIAHTPALVSQADDRIAVREVALRHEGTAQ
jgi:conjugal transfer pilus assembly protein TraW